MTQRTPSPVFIRPDYWVGDKCLADGMPWLTPGSIHRLHECLQSSDIVLEIGTGGSTIFCAERCKAVFAIETDSACSRIVQDHLIARSVDNVFFSCVPTQAEVEALLRSFPRDLFSVVNVDSIHGFDRSRFQDLALERNPHLRLLVMDNYAAPTLFPSHYQLGESPMRERLPNPSQWTVSTFDDPNWCGKGTRLFLRNQSIRGDNILMNPFSTHIPILLKCLLHTTGPILELGAGGFNTPLINAFAANRLARTIETNADWFARIAAVCHRPVVAHRHEFVLVQSYDVATIEDQQWSVAFIDHAPAEQRIKDIERLRDRCQLLVIHDTEDGAYGYEPVLKQFRYRWDFKRLLPWTSVVSDVDPLNWLEDSFKSW